MPYFMSKTASKSSWFVLMRPSGIETMDRSNRAARALISDVLPVPGGPCSNTPSFFGEPLTANRPVPAWNASNSASSSAFSGKKSESNVFAAARADVEVPAAGLLLRRLLDVRVEGRLQERLDGRELVARQAEIDGRRRVVLALLLVLLAVVDGA